MNKKLFLGMFAAAVMLLATSCSNDELDVVQSGNEAQVTFSLGLEGGIATRAISDGKSADVLMYAVFDMDGERIETIQKVSKTGVTFPTTENITLAKGQTYKVAFWAQDDDCEAYTVSDDMKVTVDYETNNTSNNDETRDAFFKTVEFTVTGSTSIDVELKRPFAQINVGVTEADWDAAVASGIIITESKVVIKNAATSINLLDGTVSGEEEVTYNFATIPAKFATAETLEVDVNRDGTIQDDEKYKYLSMSYILTSAERTTLESDGLQFTFKSGGNDIVFDEGLHQVPVQRNWRTNILGKLLTGDITFEVVIVPDYENNYNLWYPVISVTSAAELSDAIANGNENIVLAEDITYGTAINNNAVINLNNNTFEATWSFKLGNNADLTMIGGDYVANDSFGHVDVRPTTAEGSVVTFEDVNFSFNDNNGSSTNRLGTVVEVCAEVADANTKILFKNCTFDNAAVLFEGLSGVIGTFEAVFENCTFNAFTSSAPVSVANFVKGTIKMTGCTFNLECTSSSASAIYITSNPNTNVTVTAENNTINAVAATTGVDNIKFIRSYSSNTTVNETGTVKTGIAQ